MSEGSAGAGAGAGQNAAGTGQTGQNAAGESAVSSTGDAQQASGEQSSEGVNNNSEQGANNDANEQIAPDTPRSKYLATFKESHPDLDPSNEEAFFEAANERYTKLNDYKAKNTIANKNMIDAFNSNPVLTGIVRDAVKGAPMNIAIARNMDVSELAPIEGDVDEAPWKEAIETRKKKLAENEAYVKSIDENMQVSVKEVQKFAENNSLDETQTSEFLSAVDEFIAEAIQGKVNEKILSNLYRGMNADSEVANASKKAKVEGLNENIEAKKMATKPVGDGIPKPTATTTEKEPESEVKTDPFSEAIKYQLNKKRI